MIAASQMPAHLSSEGTETQLHAADLGNLISSLEIVGTLTKDKPGFTASKNFGIIQFIKKSWRLLLKIFYYGLNHETHSEESKIHRRVQMGVSKREQNVPRCGNSLPKGEEQLVV